MLDLGENITFCHLSLLIKGHLGNKPCRGAKRAVGSRHVGGSGVEVHPERDSV